MRAILAAAAILLGAGAGQATVDAIPALYDVSGVASDDVLNVRAAPSAQAEIVGTLAPDATGVEVVALTEDGSWGQVNTRERAGWVATAYLARQQGEYEGNFPQFAACFGTEPFWSLDRAAGVYRLEGLGRDPQAFLVASETAVSGRVTPFVAMAEGLGDTRLTAVVERRACSDGMSDRAYGLSVTLTLPDGEGLSGCCTLAR